MAKAKKNLNLGQRQIIAEKVASTVRILELHEYEYEVSGPKNIRKEGNKSPRVIYVDVGKSKKFRIYNSVNGHTWANEPNGKPVPGIKCLDDLYEFLKNYRENKG